MGISDAGTSSGLITSIHEFGVNTLILSAKTDELVKSQKTLFFVIPAKPSKLALK